MRQGDLPHTLGRKLTGETKTAAGTTPKLLTSRYIDGWDAKVSNAHLLRAPREISVNKRYRYYTQKSLPGIVELNHSHTQQLTGEPAATTWCVEEFSTQRPSLLQASLPLKQPCRVAYYHRQLTA